MRLAAICLLLLPATVGPLAARTPIEAGREYPGGTALESPATGIGFDLPAGFRGGWDGEGELFLAADPDRPEVMVGVWGYSDGTLEEVLAYVAEGLRERGIELRPKSPGELSATAFSGGYHAVSAEGVGVLHAGARRGAAGNSLVVAALGPAASEASLEPIVASFLDTAELTTPLAHAWRAEVGGTALTQGRFADAYSPGGAGDGSYASQTDASLDLCSNGQYAYEMQSESYLSVEGAGSLSSTKSDAHSGRWWLVADLVGSLALVLEATDGRSFIWPAEELDSGTYSVDGESYLAAPSRRCR